MSNPHAANAVDSMFNGTLSGKRAQTVLTPSHLLDAVRCAFSHDDVPQEIGYDPCPAEGSLVRPEARSNVPWAALWDRAAYLCHISQPPDKAALVWQCLRSEIRQKDIPRDIRADVVVRAAAIKKTIYSEFSPFSGCVAPLQPRAFINPPFGDRGPEVILGDFRAFCAAFARTQNECVMLGPVRCHRTWWCENILDTADCITYLRPLKFEGFDQAFPAPLFLAYKSGVLGLEHTERLRRVQDAANAFADIGSTYPAAGLAAGRLATA